MPNNNSNKIKIKIKMGINIMEYFTILKINIIH